jgi:hypothetical protein
MTASAISLVEFLLCYTRYPIDLDMQMDEMTSCLQFMTAARLKR